MLDIYFAFPILMASVFIVTGLVLLLKARDIQNVKARRSQVAISSVVSTVGVIVVLCMLFSPSMDDRHRRIQGALNSSPGDIEEIDVNPYPEPGRPSLTHVPIVIRDRAVILDMATALSRAHGISPNHPGESWHAWIKIRTKSSQFDFTVTQTGDPLNGTLLIFMSGLTEGWVIGYFRSDDFGKELEHYVRGF